MSRKNGKKEKDIERGYQRKKLGDREKEMKSIAEKEKGGERDMKTRKQATDSGKDC